MYSVKEEGPGELESGGVELVDWKQPYCGSLLDKTIGSSDPDSDALTVELGERD